MKYLVMECGLSYAVVLDSDGRFLKVPNLGYEVGQTLNNVVLPSLPTQRRPLRRQIAQWAAIAACFCIMMLGSWGFWQSPVGTVRIQINPDVQMTVNRFDRVVELEGLNADGEYLIDGYRSYGKDMKRVSDELADRAVELGFLKDGGQITLTVESERESWKTAAEELLLIELDVHFENRITVVTSSADRSEIFEDNEGSEATIVIKPNIDDDDDDEFDDIDDDIDDDDDDFDDIDDDIDDVDDDFDDIDDETDDDDFDDTDDVIDDDDPDDDDDFDDTDDVIDDDDPDDDDDFDDTNDEIDDDDPDDDEDFADTDDEIDE